jgi:hypothetical protein
VSPRTGLRLVSPREKKNILHPGLSVTVSSLDDEAEASNDRAVPGEPPTAQASLSRFRWLFLSRPIAEPALENGALVRASTEVDPGTTTR